MVYEGDPVKSDKGGPVVTRGRQDSGPKFRDEGDWSSSSTHRNLSVHRRDLETKDLCGRTGRPPGVTPRLFHFMLLLKKKNLRKTGLLIVRTRCQDHKTIYKFYFQVQRL